MFALQYFIFTHIFEFIQWVMLPTFFDVFLFVGLEYVMTTIPQYPTRFQWAICRGARSAFSPYTIQENRHWESLELNFSGKQLLKMCSTEWDGWRIFHRLDLEWPDCWNTTKQRYLTRMIVQWCITLNNIHCTSRPDIKALEFAQSSCFLFTSEAMTPTSFQVGS